MSLIIGFLACCLGIAFGRLLFDKYYDFGDFVGSIFCGLGLALVIFLVSFAAGAMLSPTDPTEYQLTPSDLTGTTCWVDSDNSCMHFCYIGDDGEKVIDEAKFASDYDNIIFVDSDEKEKAVIDRHGGVEWMEGKPFLKYLIVPMRRHSDAITLYAHNINGGNS